MRNIIMAAVGLTLLASCAPRNNYDNGQGGYYQPAQSYQGPRQNYDATPRYDTPRYQAPQQRPVRYAPGQYQRRDDCHNDNRGRGNDNDRRDNDNRWRDNDNC